MKKIIAPSILSARLTHLADEVHRVQQAGADWLHIDIMDGHFVPNLGFGPSIVKALKTVTLLPLDVHLMVAQPENLLPAFIQHQPHCLTVHVEATTQLPSIFRTLKQHNILRGLSLKPSTPIESVLPYLNEVDVLLVMTVEPGFGGQQFLHPMVEKINQLRQYLNQHSLSTLIEVDGGVNQHTAPLCHKADILVAGSFIFRPLDCAKAIEILRQPALKT